MKINIWAFRSKTKKKIEVKELGEINNKNIIFIMELFEYDFNDEIQY